MKPIVRGEVLGLAEYEAVRAHFRARVIAEKRHRRVSIGPHVSAVFENRDTALLQIQEMLRTERITREGAILHEIETYNDLLPTENELSCTLMIEIDDRAEREAFLQAARGFEDHVWLVAEGQRIGARSKERGTNPERTTAVHYLKFALPPATAEAIRGAVRTGWRGLALEVDHLAYGHRVDIPAETIASLGEDLE